MKRKKARNVTVIYSNDIWERDADGKCRVDYEKEGLFESMGDVEGWKSAGDVPDEMAVEHAYWGLEDDFGMFKDDMERFLAVGGFILTGRFGRWNGTFDGGKFIHGFNDLAKFWDGLDYLKVWDEDGHLYLWGAHHDGSCFAEVRRLTAKGVEMRDDWGYWDGSERELHEKIMKCNLFSGLPWFARKVYGVGAKASKPVAGSDTVAAS